MRKTLIIFMIIFNSCDVFEDENEVTYSLENETNEDVKLIFYRDGLRTFK